MALGSKVYDAVHLLVLHELVEGVEVADVHLYKLVIGLVLNVFQVGKVARISQTVEVDDVILGILVHEKANDMASNKAGSAGDDDCFHILLLFFDY